LIKAREDDFLFFVNPIEVRKRHANERLDQIVIKINKASRSFLLVSRKLFFSDATQSILIAILTPLDDLKAAKFQAALRTILSGTLALFIAFIAAGLVLKKIISSVKDILNVTDKIASGDFSCKAKLSDISELKTLASSINRMSDKLMEYEKKLIDSTRLMSANKITAAMAHEIKNPLSSMKMLAQIIQKRFEHDREGAQMKAAFIKEINRVDNLVSDLRTLSGPGRYSFSLFRPMLPLEEVIIIIKPKLDHLNISLTSQIDPDISEILLDKDKIKQVLWNLMMNGVESMPQGGSLSVFLKMSDKEGFIEYSVKDSGSGINQKDMDSIFTPFFTTKKEGIGIGLHVSKEIANAHKGEIKIIPTNQGTKAVLLIPCNKV
jgi:signal transduction histidine kinase